MPAHPRSLALQERPDGCNPGSVAIRDSDASLAEQHQSDGFVSRIYATSLRKVALSTRILLPIYITSVLTVVVGWWITVLLNVKSSLEDGEKSKEHGRFEEIEMAEGVGKRKSEFTHDGVEIRRTEDQHTNQSAPDTSSGKRRDSCDGSEEMIELQPRASETETRSSTWDSVDQIKAKKVFGFSGDTSPDDKKGNEAAPGTNTGGEPSTRSTTWGSSKALKVLGFERTNSRFIDEMAAGFDKAIDDSPARWARSDSRDLEEPIEHIALQEVTQSKKAQLMEHDSLQNQVPTSASDSSDYPVFGTFFVKASDFPTRGSVLATPGVTESVSIPPTQSIAQAAALSGQEDSNANGECRPKSGLQPPAARFQTGTASTPYRSLIPSDDPTSSHQPRAPTKRSHRSRANSVVHPPQVPSVSGLLRRTSSFNSPQSSNRTLVLASSMPEAQGKLLDVDSVRGKVERPHLHRFWSRFKEEFREIGSSEGREDRRHVSEEDRGGKKEALRGLRFRGSGIRDG